MDTHAIADAPAHQRILVPLDGSTASETALPFAIMLAHASHGAIYVARVHTPVVTSADLGFPLPELEQEIRQSELEYLEYTRRRLTAETQVPTSTALLDGPIGRAIRDHVKQVGATLVVISTHGRTGLSRMWLGSTADWLMRFLPVPVLAVRPSEDQSMRAPSLEHVLIALDGSERSEAIIPEAVRIGRPTRARYTLLQVVPTLVGEQVSYGTPTFPLVRDEGRAEELMRRANDYLDRIAQALRRDVPGLIVSTQVVADDHVARAILQQAASANVGLIALSSRGRGVSRLLVGSVADKVLRGFSGALLMLGPVAARELESDEIVIEEEAAADAH